MPAVMGALLSCILAALATEKEYGGKNAYVSRTSWIIKINNTYMIIKDF